MIPYIEATSFAIGPLTIQVWGLFVSLGIILGAYIAMRLAERQKLSSQPLMDAILWAVILGVIGARVFFALFYDASAIIENPISILAIWDGGMSIFGGLFGGLTGAVFSLRRSHANVWQYAEVMVFGLPFGLWIGRIGCFLIHDHPGTATDFVLGVEYPDGITRHDHGLYLSINGFLMAAAFLLLARKKRPAGFYLSLFGAWYGIVRFGLDFYRIADIRLWALTPGQYFAIIIFICSMYSLARLWKTTRFTVN
jgi:phosphatidylglycerol:prolipoprotein diacylglycerol transferase